MDPLVISYYTKNTNYEQEVEGLIASCAYWNIECDIEGIASLGSWENNCCFKPRFILEKLKQHQRPILWIDADGVVLRPLSHSFDCDISVTFNALLPSFHPSKVITNTLYVNYTPAALSLVKEWEEGCVAALNQTERKEVWDQTCFRDILLSPHTARFDPLPSSYGRIFDQITKEQLCNKTTILHFQASRHFKKWINKELAEWRGFDQVTAKDVVGFSLQEALKAVSDQGDIFLKDSSQI